jgi:hypothetical protein
MTDATSSLGAYFTYSLKMRKGTLLCSNVFSDLNFSFLVLVSAVFLIA